MTSWQSSIRANPGFAVSCRSFPNRSHSFQPASRPVLIACNFEFAGHPGIRRVCYRVGRGELLVSTPETPPAVYRVSASNYSLRIVAAAIILLFFYYAAGVVITGIFSVGYGLWTRTSDFAADGPKYRGILQEATGTVQGKLRGIEGSVNELTTPAGTPKPAVPSNTSSDVHNLLVRGIGSLYALVLEATFVPFLVFFMLAGKREAWHSTLQLFPVARRTQVKETLEDLRDVLRDYLVGMTVVSLVVIACSSIFFLALGLDYPVLTGIVSGLLNMVPYIGAVLAWLPAFLLAIVKWKSMSHFALIAIVLTGIHIVAQNLIAPQLVGRQVRLNAVAITISLLFWGWVWGGMGLILGIPITAALRVICDHTESAKPVARWLSA